MASERFGVAVTPMSSWSLPRDRVPPRQRLLHLADVVVGRRLDVVLTDGRFSERQEPQVREHRAVRLRGRVVRLVHNDQPELVMLQQPLEPAKLHRRQRLNRRDDDVAVPARVPVALLDRDHHAGMRAGDLVGRLVEQLLPVGDDQHGGAATLMQVQLGQVVEQGGEPDGFAGAGRLLDEQPVLSSSPSLQDGRRSGLLVRPEGRGSPIGHRFSWPALACRSGRLGGVGTKPLAFRVTAPRAAPFRRLTETAPDRCRAIAAVTWGGRTNRSPPSAVLRCRNSVVWPSCRNDVTTQVVRLP
jgi:hypothetical protein